MLHNKFCVSYGVFFSILLLCLVISPMDIVQAAQNTTASSGGGYLSSYQEPVQQSTQSSWLSTFAYLISVIIAFAFVAGLAYFVSRFLGQKLGGMNSAKSSKVLESLPLGNNKALYVVEIAGKVVVLGVTDHNINLLQEITDEIEIARLRTQASSDFANDSFSNMFEKQVISLEQISRKFPNVFNNNKDRK